MVLDKNGFYSWKTLFYVFLIYFCQMAVWLLVGFVGRKQTAGCQSGKAVIKAIKAELSCVCECVTMAKLSVCA